MKLEAYRLNIVKILVMLLLLSCLAPAQGQEAAPAAAASLQDISRHLQQFWLEPMVLPQLLNHPPQEPSLPNGPDYLEPAAIGNYSTFAIDPDGDQMIYSFDWGDGNYSYSAPSGSGIAVTASHTWRRSGKYRVLVRATDDKNASSSWSLPWEVTVNSPPERPVVGAARSIARPGESISFSVSGNDPDADSMRYIIDWGDGTHSTSNWTQSGEEVKREHSWQRSGNFEIKARVQDGINALSPWSELLTVIINNPPRQPAPPSGPGSGYALAPYHFQAYADDPDGDSLNYTFDWGDGTSDTLDFLGPGSNVSASHAWNQSGAYMVRVMAQDRMGGYWSGESLITIAANEPPQQPRDLYGLRAGYTGTVYNYFTMAGDPDGDSVKFVLDWGDGIASETDYVQSGSLENASHIWSRPGEYHVLASAVDEKGAPSRQSGPFLVLISANNPPQKPQVPSGPKSGLCSFSHEYATSATDPDGDKVKYVFDWGDGTTSWTGQDYSNSGEEGEVSHRWKKPGVYRIIAAAMDDKGLISEWSGALHVKME